MLCQGLACLNILDASRDRIAAQEEAGAVLIIPAEDMGNGIWDEPVRGELPKESFVAWVRQRGENTRAGFHSGRPLRLGAPM
jgi:hypothetical protein